MTVLIKSNRKQLFVFDVHKYSNRNFALVEKSCKHNTIHIYLKILQNHEKLYNCQIKCNLREINYI